MIISYDIDCVLPVWGMVIMRIEGTIPTQAELTHMVAEVDQVPGPAAVLFD